jgi:uncharacterized membrane protein
MLFDYLISNRIKKSPSVGAPRWISATKALSWRVVGTIDTLIISFFVTGQINLALTIGGIELITKMVLYYLHERLWERIRSRAK